MSDEKAARKLEQKLERDRARILAADRETRGLVHDGNNWFVVPVPRDGNCLFHALNMSQLITHVKSESQAKSQAEMQAICKASGYTFDCRRYGDEMWTRQKFARHVCVTWMDKHTKKGHHDPDLCNHLRAAFFSAQRDIILETIPEGKERTNKLRELSVAEVAAEGTLPDAAFVKDYLLAMQENGEWGAMPELYAFSRHQNTQICVYPSQHKSVSDFSTTPTELVAPTHTIHLLHENSDHYCLLIRGTEYDSLKNTIGDDFVKTAKPLGVYIGATKSTKAKATAAKAKPKAKAKATPKSPSPKPTDNAGWGLVEDEDVVRARDSIAAIVGNKSHKSRNSADIRALQNLGIHASDMIDATGSQSAELILEAALDRDPGYLEKRTAREAREADAETKAASALWPQYREEDYIDLSGYKAHADPAKETDEEAANRKKTMAAYYKRVLPKK